MLRQERPHDEDYSMFRIFTSAGDVILDIGANWGQSVGSIWASGARGRVISFEPWEPHRQCLRQIAELRPDRFDYRMVALGSSDGSIRVIAPVINGKAITGLATGSASPHLESLAANILSHIQRWLGSVDEISLRLFQFEAPLRKLDSLALDGTMLRPGETICAMKIDVEGLEYEVLLGAARTLNTYKPLILAEGGNRPPGIAALAASLGYGYFERQGSRLVRNDGVGRALNGFFAHHERLEQYRQSGLLGGEAG